MSDNYDQSYLVINRFYNSHILDRVELFEDVSKSLFGVQAQIANSSSFAFALRVNNPIYDNYLISFDKQNLIKIWGIRTTLHSYTIEDLDLVLSQVSTSDNWFSKKMKKNGVDTDLLIEKTLDLIKNIDVFDRDFLIDGGIPSEYLGSWGDLLIELNNRGYITHIVSNKREKKFRTIKKNIDKHNQYIYQTDANFRTEIASRYFQSYGPATVKDFAHWLGCSLESASSYMKTADKDIGEIKYRDQLYYATKERIIKFDYIYQMFIKSNHCWLLPKFDPLLLAYKDKTWIARLDDQKKIWKKAGHVEGIVVQNWKAIATWKYKIGQTIIDFTVDLFNFDINIDFDSLQMRFTELARFRKLALGAIRIYYQGAVVYDSVDLNNKRTPIT